MPSVVELPDELAAALAEEAARAGVSLSDYAARLLANARPEAGTVKTGGDLVAYWRAEGLIGNEAGGAGSPGQARRLREEAQCCGG